MALAVVSALAAVCAGVLHRPDHQSCEICCMSEATCTAHQGDAGTAHRRMGRRRRQRIRQPVAARQSAPATATRTAASASSTSRTCRSTRASAPPRRENGGVRVDLRGRDARRHVQLRVAGGARRRRRAPRRPELAVRTWLEGGALDARRDFAWASFAALRGEPRRAARVADATAAGRTGVPRVACRTSEGAILSTVPLIGRVLETNYGLTFDVRSVPQPENLAYSDLGLGLHTDNPYRDPVPGFQALHALIASNEGGDSVFADGFALAEHLRTSDPEAFGQLTSTAIPFLYRSKDAELYAERPLIQLSASGAIAAVHYNSRSIAPLAHRRRGCGALLRRLPALCRAAARAALAAAHAAGFRHAGRVRQPAGPARAHGLLLRAPSAAPAGLLSHARQRLQRGGAAAAQACGPGGEPHEHRRGNAGALWRARLGGVFRRARVDDRARAAGGALRAGAGSAGDAHRRGTAARRRPPARDGSGGDRGLDQRCAPRGERRALARAALPGLGLRAGATARAGQALPVRHRPALLLRSSAPPRSTRCNCRGDRW